MAALQTMPYMPPEVLEHSELTLAADTYSFGMIMWESFTGEASPRLFPMLRGRGGVYRGVPALCASFECHTISG